MKHLPWTLAILLGVASIANAEIIIAEGESFKPLDAKGWKVTHQQGSYASHTYGGMWMTHGGCLGAKADSVGSVASKKISVKDAGTFRVWSKYQAPPYFNYLHKIEIEQAGKVVYSHTYGKKGTDRLWSFSGVSDECWWPWGVDHDCAEAPTTTIAMLQAGDAEIRLITVANPKPAGDRFVDFVVLTTNLQDEYQGFKPYKVGSPFTLEALAATRLYVRFQNNTDKPDFLSVTRNGHYQPNYGGATIKIPDPGNPKAPLNPPVLPGQWSKWINIGPFCKLVHDEGLFLNLPGAKEFAVQFARDEAGKELVGDMKVVSGEAVSVPIDITWNKAAKVKPSREWAQEIIKDSKNWRRANGGKKPKELLYYGAFSGNEDWVNELKATLGYNTHLPAKYEPVPRSNLHAHTHSIKEIEAYAGKLTPEQKANLRVLSFGDEISLGNINYKDAKLQEKFRAWLKAKKIDKEDLGVAPEEAVLTAYSTGASRPSARQAWYSQQFNEEERFAHYRAMTARAKELIGPHVLTGANYSPHHGCLYYGPIYQWVDVFKHQGMTMMWAEDYVFSVPEVPQIVSWQFAQMRCATKYHNHPIHFYVMPHAPGQEPGFLRRNMVLGVGFGARHIDNFWIGPEERFTENYVAWKYKDTFRVLSESIYDSAEVEKFVVEGKVRPAEIAIVMSKATDYNESRLMVPKEKDPFAAQCKNAPKLINQTLCRKEQQMLYLALRHAQHAVDCITEEDILDGYLKNLKVVYFAGEWIDNRIIPKLEEWVKSGGVLYCCGGCGHKNQFDEPEPAMLKLLGLKEIKTTKNAYHMRTLLELPLCEAIDDLSIYQKNDKVSAIAMKQILSADNAAVIGKWSDGTAAVTQLELGKGHVFAVGTLSGTSYLKTGLKPIPWPRGGCHMIYNPTRFEFNAGYLTWLWGIVERPAAGGDACVERIVLDHKDGTLLTLVNWTNAPVEDFEVRVRMKDAPKTVRTVSGQRNLAFTAKDGVVSFRLGLAEADYVLLMK